MPNLAWNYGARAALWTLACLHVYWAILIVSMIIKAIRDKGVSDDVRNKNVKVE